MRNQLGPVPCPIRPSCGSKKQPFSFVESALRLEISPSDLHICDTRIQYKHIHRLSGINFRIVISKPFIFALINNRENAHLPQVTQANAQSQHPVSCGSSAASGLPQHCPSKEKYPSPIPLGEKPQKTSNRVRNDQISNPTLETYMIVRCNTFPTPECTTPV